ncbi:hypothetical protein K2Z84_21450 [Candidatus Binatia bacterium]|nr:hypothetical protein [Candidatus Binatia bacterium]
MTAMKLECTECGNAHPGTLQMVESVGRYWDITTTAADFPRVALFDSNDLDDGDSAYRLYCRECGHVEDVPEGIEIEYV